MAKKAKEKKQHLVSARFSESALEKLERVCDREGRTRSDVVRRLVERAIGCKRVDC